MTLEKLKQYYKGQRFICKHTSLNGVEVFELHIKYIIDEPWGRELGLFFKYRESWDGGDDFETVWIQETLDDLVEDCWNCEQGWEFLGWIPIEPLNELPDEYFRI